MVCSLCSDASKLGEILFMQHTPRFFSRPASLGFAIPNFATEKGICASGEWSSGGPGLQLDGKAVAEQLVLQCKSLLESGRRVRPHLAVVLVGDDAASQVYVANKERMFLRAGFSTETIKLKATEVNQQGLIELVKGLSQDTKVHGILVQLPLPAGFSAAQVLAAISPAKDVDGYLKENVGKLALCDFTGLPACTPYGVMVLLSAYGVSFGGKHALVVGRSNTVGKPMAQLLLAEDATVTVAHSRTANLPSLLNQADIVVAAAGKPRLISSQHLKPGAIVVDVGIHRQENGKLCGDCETEGLSEKVRAYSPVPGGVGPMTIAMLLVNTAMAAWDKSEP